MGQIFVAFSKYLNITHNFVAPVSVYNLRKIQYSYRYIVPKGAYCQIR